MGMLDATTMSNRILTKIRTYLFKKCFPTSSGSFGSQRMQSGLRLVEHFYQLEQLHSSTFITRNNLHICSTPIYLCLFMKSFPTHHFGLQNMQLVFSMGSDFNHGN